MLDDPLKSPPAVQLLSGITFEGCRSVSSPKSVRDYLIDRSTSPFIWRSSIDLANESEAKA